MNRDYQDRVVVVTGASSGIGAALVRCFAKAGAKLVLAARHEKPLQQVAATLPDERVLIVPTDVAQQQQVQHLIQQSQRHFGQVDVLINNAGYGLTASVEELEASDLERLLAVNLYGVLYGVQAVLPLMKKQRSGQIINVSSVLSHRSLPNMSAYCLSKSAVGALTDSLRSEVAAFGIDVLLAEPGLTDTRFSDNRQIIGDHPRRQSLGKAMSPERCAEKIFRAARKNKARVSLTTAGRSLILAQKLAPGIVDRVLRQK